MHFRRVCSKPLATPSRKSRPLSLYSVFVDFAFRFVALLFSARQRCYRRPAFADMTLLKALAPVVAVFLTVQAGPIAGQGRSPSDLEIRQAANAIEQADSYDEIVAATERYASVISSPRVVELVDQLLQNPSLNETQRGVLLLERQLRSTRRAFGGAAAAKLLAIRVIAGNAMSADTPQQLAAALDKFSPLAGAMTVALVRQALDTPGNSWPKPLLPLMEQLARDWPKFGSLGAATRMAEAANKVAPPAPQAGSEPGADAGRTLAQHDDLLREPAR